LEKAADALDAALRHGALPIQAEMQLSAWLVQALIRQKDVSQKQLTTIARRFGWDDPAASIADPAIGMLQARIAAENFFAMLRRRSRSPALLLGLPRAGAARLLRGRGLFIFSWLLPPQPPLLEMLSELRIHWPFLSDRFDAARIARVEHLVNSLLARAEAVSTYPRRPRWPNIFDRYNRAATVVALLPAVSIGVAAGSFLTGFLIFNVLRGVLSQAPRLKRPFALLGITIALFMALVVWARSETDELTYVPSLGNIPYANKLPDFRMEPSLPERMVIPKAELMAARIGDREAMLGIGEKILEGAKETEEVSRAAAWLTAAANRGSIPAMFDLDRIYMNADGLLYDSLRAYFWSGVAVRLARDPGAVRTARQDHARATDLIYWKHRPDLDKQIRVWQPHGSALPTE